MNLPDRDGDGYLTDMNAWTEEIGRAMAEADGYELDEAKWNQILKAREYYEEFGGVPPIRKFAKYLERRPECGVQALDDRPDEADHQVRRTAQADRLRVKSAGQIQPIWWLRQLEPALADQYRQQVAGRFGEQAATIPLDQDFAAGLAQGRRRRLQLDPDPILWIDWHGSWDCATTAMGPPWRVASMGS